MVPTETKEIDGFTFRVAGLKLQPERVLLVRLTKTVGPALVELMRGGSAAAPEAAGVLLGNLTDAEVDHLIDTFKVVTEVRMETAKGEAWVPYVETAFKNGASSQFKWLWFCLEHQFGGFLGSDSGKFEKILEDLLTRLKAKASPSTSPQT